MHIRRQALAAAIALLLGACATGSETGTVPAVAPPADSQGDVPASGYVLTADEQALDCKQLTGRMQVRILQLRDFDTRQKTTVVSRVAQTAASTVFGGTNYGTDPERRYARDRAVLEAYNKQLAAKKCRTFDLEAELKANPANSVPKPVAPAEKPKS